MSALARRCLIAAALLASMAGCAKVTERRVEQSLVEAGLPGDMAACMAKRMSDRLSIAQLRKLEKLRPQEGESDIPLTMAEYLERVHRVDDPEVIEVTASSAAMCAFGMS